MESGLSQKESQKAPENKKKCSYCRETIKEGQGIEPCECGTIYHEDCLEYYTWQAEHHHSAILCHTCKKHYHRVFRNAWYQRLYQMMNLWNKYFFYFYFIISFVIPGIVGLASLSYPKATRLSLDAAVTCNHLSWLLLLTLTYCWDFRLQKPLKYYLLGGLSFLAQWSVLLPRNAWIDWFLFSTVSFAYTKTKPLLFLASSRTPYTKIVSPPSRINEFD